MLHSLAGIWHEIQPIPELRAQALRLLRVHVLRADDALQLAAGITLGRNADGG